MMASKNSGKQLHFLLFPWLALGHINPFVELSKGLAMNGHTVSFLSTPVNISRIKRSLTTQDWPGRIDLLEMPLPPTEGLTSGAECTADVPNEMAAQLKNAMDSMEKPFRSLLGQLSPDYVVHDFSQFWTQSVAAEIGVPAVFFIVFSPATCAHSFHPAKLRNPGITVEEVAAPPRGFPSSAISFSLYEARGELPAYREVPGQLSPAFRTARCLEGCLAVAVKSSFEDEDKYIRYFQDVNNVPVLSVGPLMPVLQPVARASKGSNLMEWLDKQREASVVFVSFGSETFLSREQVRELALGLEASGLMFLWSLRSSEAHPLGLLPEGFQTRTRDMGIITGEWVPQLQIVSHPAVGGYLCHAGWSSAMEALSFGLPLILVPIKFDQFLNARQIAAELKAGIEIEREDDGSFLKENVCETVRMVMMGEEGKHLRLKAAEARDILVGNNGRQQSYIDDFVQRIEQLRGKKNMEAAEKIRH